MRNGIGSSSPRKGNAFRAAGSSAQRVRERTLSVRDNDAVLAWLLLIPAIAVSAGLVFYPLVLGFIASLHAGGPAFGTNSQYVGFQNYSDIVSSPEARSAFLHTLAYLGIALVLETVGGLTIALVVHRLTRGRNLLLAIMILPWALPPVVNGVLWQRIFDPDNGYLNSVLLHLHIISKPVVWLASGGWGIVLISLVHVWGVIPLASLIYLAGLQSIPEDVYSASAVDGATPVRQFVHITLPLLRPSVAVALTIGTVWGVSIFGEIFVLNGTALNTRSIFIEIYNLAFATGDFWHAGAFAFLAALITSLLAVMYVMVARRRTT